MTKSELFEVGGKLDREKMASQWNAVYIDGEWRFVDCFWASVCVENKGSKDFITMDKNGNVKHMKNGETQAQPFNEFYFLCDPEKLLWTHFPDEEEWQLLKVPISAENFRERLYVREQFHLLEFSLPSGASERGILTSYQGEPVEIKFIIPARRSLFYKFAYVLSQARNEIETNHPVDILLERFVLMEHKEEFVRFMVRFPFCGQFQMDIYAADEEVSKEYKLCCTYTIECKEISREPDLPLPDNPDVGWGCSPIAIDAGITLVRPKESAIIQTKTGQLEMIFSIEGIEFLSHCLKSCVIDESTLSQYVMTKRDKERYIVQVRLPKAGEYALKIYADDARYMKDYMPRDIVNFFLVFEGNKTNPPFPHLSGGKIGTKTFAERFGVEVLSYPNGTVKAWGGKVRLEFETHTDNISLTCDMCGFSRESNNRMSCILKHFEDNWIFDVDLPIAGEYTVNVYAILNDDKTTLYEVQSYFITSIVQNEKRVKFQDDKERDDIITAAIRTSEETIKIPIPKAEENEIVYTRISRMDGKDEEGEDRPTVTNLGESFEINIKEDGQYGMDVWVHDADTVLEKVAKFTIHRRQSFDSFTDDIEALIEMLKPQEKQEEEKGEEEESNRYSETESEVEEDTDYEQTTPAVDEDKESDGEEEIFSRQTNHDADENDDDENEELDRQIKEGLVQGAVIANGINHIDEYKTTKEYQHTNDLDKMSAINEESEADDFDRDTYSVRSGGTRSSVTTDVGLGITAVVVANEVHVSKYEEKKPEKTYRTFETQTTQIEMPKEEEEKVQSPIKEDCNSRNDNDKEENDVEDIEIVMKANGVNEDGKIDQNMLSESDRAASRALDTPEELLILDLDAVEDENLKARLREGRSNKQNSDKISTQVE